MQRRKNRRFEQLSPEGVIGGATAIELYQILSRDTCKNLQDGLESIAISSFQRFPLPSL
ncbi:MAG: hypothetical protein KME50_38550 [Nostoc desertorum CM1-VF14]|nr:hypothetical protein [Nostoc desertorum CM1-VF14]